ncbi:hypothetical protein GO986_12040 [Deinococcus sp. HMF7620]|uniref:Integrase n=1 Tax=Deinococcus arboris TaxID=2682977 RepID=A0A7C9HZY6_9DEIO|nr:MULTISPECIES: hypothetical protein [Deinococcus]MBZ9752153.1 hypothetical protein [Deinococcus betulae]MVN87495.1 hypothetical protein [Deinococcus arboris]
MPEELSTDELARKVTQALHELELDTLISALHERDRLPGRAPQLISNLRPIFEAARRDHVSLLRPPADFQPWLQRVILTNIDGTEAKGNTRISRVTALRALYRALRKLELLHGDPLVDFQLPSVELRSDPLPPKAAIEKLLKAAKSDPNLFAALLLVWHHALPMTTLLRLKWSAFNPEKRTLLRDDVVTPLTAQAAAALERLLHQAGYDPLYPETLAGTQSKRMFPYDTLDALRLRVLQTCTKANLKFIPPGLIKKCALRDHARSAAHLGYRVNKHYKKVIALAQGISVNDAK